MCVHYLIHKVLEETVKLSHHNGADVSQQFGLILSAAGKEKVSMFTNRPLLVSMNYMASASHDSDGRKCTAVLT